jgi:hypothetical protein
MRHHRCLACLCFVAFCSGLLLITHHVSAVTCVNPDVKGQVQAWAKGATVLVNVSGFAAALQPCIKTAFDNWNAANIDNGSNVFLHVQDGTPINTTGQTNVWQVTQQPSPDPATGYPRVAGTGGQTNGTNRVNATTNVDPNVTDCTALTQTTAHEIGHTFGLGECTSCNGPQQSVMIGVPCAQRDTAGKCVVPVWNDTTFGLPGPTTPCDNNTVNTVYNPPPPPPPPPPTCGYCPNPNPACYYPPAVCGSSPILIDISGRGFDLTSAAGGVKFDISGMGNPIQMAWSAAGADNAFLALPSADGLVHGGKQLFGDYTPQPTSATPNGFAALAVYDDPKNGGNGDGVIDSRDAIFASLRLWIDANHDGISQPEEIHTLASLGVNSISLTYKLSEKEDHYGNRFRYRARVNPDDPDASHVGRTAYDVFFVTLDSPGTAENMMNPKGQKCAVPTLLKGGMLSTTRSLR